MLSCKADEMPTTLSLSQKADGRRRYLSFSLLNGISVVCLAQSTLILYCLKCGASDALTGIIASFMYLSMFFMLFGKKLVRSMGAAGTIKLCWILRNTFAMCMLLVPMVSSWLSPALGLGLIMVCAFGFFAFRSAGMIGMQPLIREIVSDDNRGRFLSRIFLNFCVSNVLFMGLIILLFSYSKSVQAFQIIILVGAVAGYVSSFFIGSIQESHTPRLSASKPLLDVFHIIRKKKRYLKLLFAHCFSTSGMVLVIPFSMMALKSAYHVSDQIALVYAMVQMIGGMSVSYLNSVLSEETGPRPLIIIYFSCFLVVTGLWCLAPDTFVWYYFVPIFLLTGLCSMGIMLNLSHYFILSIPPGEMVGVSLVITASSGVITGVTGTVLGGGAMKLLSRHFGDGNLTGFKAYFLGVAALLIIFILVISRLERIKDWNTGKVISLLFAPRDLRTLFLLHHLEAVSAPQIESDAISKLESSKSELSEKKLLESLKSPKFSMRAKAMLALQQIPFGDNAEKALMDELENGQYSTAYIAAQILGEQHVTKAIPLLEKALHSPDPYLQSKCMIALVQLKATGAYDQIKAIFRETSNPRLIIHGANALVEMQDPSALPLLLEKLKQKDIPEPVTHEIIFCISEILGTGDDFYQFLRLFHDDREKAAAFAVNIVEKHSLDNTTHSQLIEDINHFCREPENPQNREPLLNTVAELVRTDHLSQQMWSLCHAHLREEDCGHPELAFCAVFRSRNG